MSTAALRSVRARAASRASLRPGQTVALVNVDFGPGTVLGISLIGAGILLYQVCAQRPLVAPCAGSPPASIRLRSCKECFGSRWVLNQPLLPQVRTVRPEISRDYDVFFSSVGLLTGGILVFQVRCLNSTERSPHFMVTPKSNCLTRARATEMNVARACLICRPCVSSAMTPSIIMLSQGWRLDPLLFFGQLLTATSALAFAVRPSSQLSARYPTSHTHRPKSYLSCHVCPVVAPP